MGGRKDWKSGLFGFYCRASWAAWQLQAGLLQRLIQNWPMKWDLAAATQTCLFWARLRLAAPCLLLIFSGPFVPWRQHWCKSPCSSLHVGFVKSWTHRWFKIQLSIVWSPPSPHTRSLSVLYWFVYILNSTAAWRLSCVGSTEASSLMQYTHPNDTWPQEQHVSPGGASTVSRVSLKVWHKFQAFSCIFTSFTAFPTDKDLPRCQS